MVAERPLESIREKSKEENKELLAQAEERLEKMQKEVKAERFFWVIGMILLFNVILLFAFSMSDISGFHMTWVIATEFVLEGGWAFRMLVMPLIKLF